MKTGDKIDDLFTSPVKISKSCCHIEQSTFVHPLSYSPLTLLDLTFISIILIHCMYFLLSKFMF